MTETIYNTVTAFAAGLNYLENGCFTGKSDKRISGLKDCFHFVVDLFLHFFGGGGGGF